MVLTTFKNVLPCRKLVNGRQLTDARWRYLISLSLLCTASFSSEVFGQRRTEGGDAHSPAPKRVTEIAADTKRQVGSELQSSENSARPSYQAFGVVQVFESRDSLWIFVDIDHHENAEGSSSPTSMRTLEFRAFRIAVNGEVHEWRSRLHSLSAHRNVCAIAFHRGHVYINELGTPRWYRLVSQQNRLGTVEQTLPLENFDGVRKKGQGFVDLAKKIELSNKANGFRLIGFGNYGYGSIEDTDTVSSKNSAVLLRFFSEDSKLGWVKVEAILKRRARDMRLRLVELSK